MKISIFLFVFSLSFLSFAYSPVLIEEEVYIPDSNKKYLPMILKNSALTVDHVTSKGYELYGPSGLMKWLEIKKIKFFKKNELYAPSLYKTSQAYLSHEEMLERFKQMAKKYPAIAQLQLIGKSVQNREIYALKISDNVQKDELEPEVKLISTMHGDEITGRDLIMMFAEDLLPLYGKNHEVTKLINNTEIFLLPNMNPDGTFLRRRGNANYVDLNRNFPDMTRPEEVFFKERPIEIQHIMKWQSQRKFALSANYHGGAEVVNYPWDSIRERHPLDGMAQEISLEYASKVYGMANSREFKNGIVNGYDWYSIRGSMQDYTTFFHDDFQITIEVSKIKWPKYSEISRYYNENRLSMFNFLKRVHQGAGFYITNFKDKIGTVSIYVQDKLLGTFPFTSSQYYKVLPKGEYKFIISVDGFVKNLNVKVSDFNEINNNGNYYPVML